MLPKVMIYCRRLFMLCGSLPVQTVLAFVFFGAYHTLLRAWMKHSGCPVGALEWRRQFVPFYAKVHADPWLSWWLVPALAVMAIFFLIVRRLYLRGTLRPAILLALSGALFIAITISVAMIDGTGKEKQDGSSIPALLAPYTRVKPYINKNLEYYADAPRVAAVGVVGFLRNYAKPEFFKTISAHAKTHPPGGSLFQWLASLPFGHNLWSAAIFTILFTATAVLPAFLLARVLYGDTVARWSLALFLLVPSFQLFTATCMDGPFSVFPIWSVFFFYRALRAELKVPWAVLTGVATAAGIFMTYAAFSLGIVFGVTLILTLVVNRRKFLDMFVVLSVAAMVFLICYLLLFLATDFNLVEALQASIRKDESMMGKGYRSASHYVNVGLANLVAFLVGAGISLTVAWGLQCATAVRGLLRDRGEADVHVLAFPVAIVAIAFSTLFNLEVERIWLFLVPFLVIPAAKCVNELCARRSSLFPFYWVSGIMALQLLAAEAILKFPW